MRDKLRAFEAEAPPRRALADARAEIADLRGRLDAEARLRTPATAEALRAALEAWPYEEGASAVLAFPLFGSFFMCRCCFR